MENKQYGKNLPEKNNFTDTQRRISNITDALRNELCGRLIAIWPLGQAFHRIMILHLVYLLHGDFYC